MTPYVVYGIADERWIASAYQSRSMKAAIEAVGVAKYTSWMNLAKLHRPDLVDAMRAQLIVNRERENLPRCGHEGCERPVKVRDLCKRHYEQWLAVAEPEMKLRRVVYPSDDQIVTWFEADSSIAKVARRIGVSRETLSAYISCRPLLAVRVEGLRKPPLLAPEEAARRNRAAQAAWRKANPENVREINRRWASNQDPAKRRRWNNYNRVRRTPAIPLTPEQLAETRDYQQVLKGDPCVYCGRPGLTVDHVRPISSGGSDFWENNAAACQSCNSQKNDKELLFYLLWRLDNAAEPSGGGATNPVDPDGR